MAEAEVQIDASRGAVTVRGEQSFVSEMLEKYKSVFESAPKPLPTTSAADQGAKGAGATPSGASVSNDFPNVFDIEGENISILAGPPGNTMTAQARALILLYLYARYKASAEPTGAELIKDQCKIHACFDSKNFAGHLKSQKSFVTVTGTNSTMAARLTVPGRKAAEELAQKLQAGE